MAKKVVKKSGELPNPLKAFQSLDDRSQVMSESDSAPAEWISTGSYILNAAISGSIRKGIPSNRVVLFAGESGTGKSFLVNNVAREAQKMNYNILYLDSEGAIDAQFVTRLGVDPEKMIIRNVSTIQETTHVILKLIDMCEKEEESYGTHSKWMVVIDSIGNLASGKEKEDQLKIDPTTGTVPRDMSKAQAVKSLFRCVTSPLNRLQIPLLCVSHTYTSMALYAPNSISGGSGVEYNASVIVELSKSKLDDKLTNKKAEESTNSADLTRTGILVTTKIRKSRFTIPRKGRLMISYFVPMRPEFHLESYLNWDNAQVGRGAIITQKDYEKMTPAEQNKVKTYEYNGQTCYAYLKDTARTIVVARKNVAVPIAEFLSSKIFDDEFLDYIDENIIRPLFELPSVDKLKELESIEAEALEALDEDE